MLDSTSDEGVLDHVLAKIIPVVTSLRAHSQKTKDQSSIHPTPFVTKEAFIPAEKNGTQLRFYKVKTAGRIQTKFTMKYVVQTCTNIVCIFLHAHTRTDIYKKCTTGIQTRRNNYNYRKKFSNMRCIYTYNIIQKMCYIQYTILYM